ncbi:hypothetical protein [Caenispirillum bisanense]|uniref:hypothetical protein n=1 Tax=Caenispirillum bisanense TaxID=414052 RepID=UPI0031DC4DEE
MPQSLPPIPEPDLGPPPALRAFVLSLGAAAGELTLELMILGVALANPWVSLALLGIVYLVLYPLLNARDARLRREWRARWGVVGSAASER